MQFKGNTDESSAKYWDDLTEVYQKETRISTGDFHYGPLLPGDSTLQLLPPRLRRGSGAPADSIRCLEIGCGAGQNSIFLAKQGAQCIATDISKEQLAHGRKIAKAEGASVDFRRISMDSLGDLQTPPRPSLRSGHPARGGGLSEFPPLGECPQGGKGLFDLIHSTYALPFSAEPAKVITDATTLLKPGGTLLLTTGHPLYAGEWLDIGDGEDGVFLPDYFRPEPDVRMSLDDKTMNAAQNWPVSTLAEWLHDAGLVIERLLEPAPMPIPEMSKREILEKVPYDSKDWRALYDQLARIPVVLIFKAMKLNT